MAGACGGSDSIDTQLAEVTETTETPATVAPTTATPTTAPPETEPPETTTQVIVVVATTDPDAVEVEPVEPVEPVEDTATAVAAQVVADDIDFGTTDVVLWFWAPW